METNKEEYIYSSFDQRLSFVGTDPAKISYKIETINGVKTFLAYSVLPRPFDNYNVITGFSMQSAFDEGGYEARSCFFKAGVAERIIEGAKQLLDEMK